MLRRLHKSKKGKKGKRGESKQLSCGIARLDHAPVYSVDVHTKNISPMKM